MKVVTFFENFTQAHTKHRAIISTCIISYTHTLLPDLCGRPCVLVHIRVEVGIEFPGLMAVCLRFNMH